MELFSSIARLTESINANGQPQTPSSLPFTVAGQLKMYWCDEPNFAKLFIDMSQYERIKYVVLRL